MRDRSKGVPGGGRSRKWVIPTWKRAIGRETAEEEKRLTDQSPYCGKSGGRGGMVRLISKAYLGKKKKDSWSKGREFLRRGQFAEEKLLAKGANEWRKKWRKARVKKKGSRKREKRKQALKEEK